jgi:hypothetical protein
MAFMLDGSGSTASICLGTWSPDWEAASAGVLEERQSIEMTILDGLYPRVDVSDAGISVPDLPCGGLVLGVPTQLQPDPTDGSLPVDRLLQAMAGQRWAVLVLALPVDGSVVAGLRHQVINELRDVGAQTQSSGAPSPLGEHYTELLKGALSTLTGALAIGAWRTAVYLLGDKAGYYCLASVWRAMFSGPKSLPEPVRVVDTPAAVELAGRWCLPNASAPPGPGHYQHPYGWQTLLSSTQLAAYVHLPQLETGGFTVKVVPDFDVVPQTVDEPPAIHLGDVVQRGRKTHARYEVGARSLAGHTFVTGMTGQGKTNSVLSVLAELARSGIAFLVVEPAKAEYRAVVGFTSPRIFTVGDETVSPLRLNPFEVPDGIAVGVHLDLLRSVFAASFAMWVPLPQVLEQCLVEIYQDRGWDIPGNHNERGDWADREAFPTLSDLVAKVGEVVPKLGFDPEARDRVLASLRTRLEGLRSGGKGRMLDVRRSIPMADILGAPTILELENLGDDDDKAFVMGLVFIRLVEHRRVEEEQRRHALAGGDPQEATGTPPELKHVLVIEEAHRLLSSVPRVRDADTGDPRGKAVETFSNLLSEIRAYGQGVIIADQIPSRLAPDVIKNTNLKIAHRIVAGDDRHVLGQAMAMSQLQESSLTNLERGQAAVFSDRDDAPLVVAVESIKDRLMATVPDDDCVDDAMRTFRSGRADLFRRTHGCEGECPAEPDHERACVVAQRIAEDRAFQRILSRVILSVIEDDGALERTWGDLMQVVQVRRPLSVDEQDLWRCLAIRGAEWLAQRRGSQVGWSYEDARRFEARLRALLLARVRALPVHDELARFQSAALALFQRHFEPYPLCSVVCDQQTPAVCLYRQPARELLSDDNLTDPWREADQEDTSSEGRTATWEKSMDAGFELVDSDWETVTGPAWRASLCFAQQMLAADDNRSPSSVSATLDLLYQTATKEEA